MMVTTRTRPTREKTKNARNAFSGKHGNVFLKGASRGHWGMAEGDSLGNITVDLPRSCGEAKPKNSSAEPISFSGSELFRSGPRSIGQSNIMLFPPESDGGAIGSLTEAHPVGHLLRAVEADHSPGASREPTYRKRQPCVCFPYQNRRNQNGHLRSNSFTRRACLGRPA